MKASTRPPNTSIYNTTNFDFKATYGRLRQSEDIRGLVESQKGHIICWLKQPEVFIEVSPRGKVIIYYNNYDDRNEAVSILKRLVVCHGFSTEQDLPRKLESVQDGIIASLADRLTEPELSLRLKYERYIAPTASPKTFAAMSEGLRKYFKVFEELESTTEWIVTFGMTVTEEILPNLNYVETCDRLTKELTSALEESPYEFRISEDDRDGEGLTLRYAFVWRPADDPLELPKFPYAEYWERLELAPFKEIYPNSDFEDIYGDDDLDSLS
jgi:hypothetical protein